jgi:phosphoglycolate phosphatase
MTHKRRRVLFDLDGTLANTAPDLCRALNAVLAEQGQPALPLSRVRPAASQGAIGMLRLAWPDAADALLEPLRQRFIVHYRAHLCTETHLFPGMLDLLADLERRGIVWGIVTNKLADLTLPLLAMLGLERRAACIVSGDTTTHPKPHPAPLLYACSMLGCLPADAVYVGDSVRDVEAARRAGMAVVIAAWGYLDDTVPPAQWDADLVISHPSELLRWEGLAVDPA